MEYNIGVGRGTDLEASVQEATAKFRNPKLILFFSEVDVFDQYTELMHRKFPNCICMGATSIAMFSHTGADKSGIKAIGFESGIKCSAGVLEDVDKYPIKYVERVKRCVDAVGETRNTICLEFTTALLCAEESVLSALNTVLIDKGIPVFGGTAGDSGTATGTKVRWGTVAVDPSRIPYGTRMFIIANDGSYVYGIATAEDCGGDIKGDRMDLYMPTYEQCMEFGRRVCTVYFLG